MGNRHNFHFLAIPKVYDLNTSVSYGSSNVGDRKAWAKTSILNAKYHANIKQQNPIHPKHDPNQWISTPTILIHSPNSTYQRQKHCNNQRDRSEDRHAMIIEHKLTREGKV